MTKTTFASISIALLALAACGKDKGGGGGGAAAGTGVAIDPAAVNSLVPEPLKAKLTFEKRDVVLEMGKDKTTYTLSVPKGWEHTSKMFGKLEPPKDADVGFFTKLDVGSNCNGECKPKDWAAESEKAHFKADGKVLKDVKGKGNRLMIAETTTGGANMTVVTYAWWTDGASKYRYCRAELDDDIKDAAPAFEKACQAITVVGED